MKHFVIVQLVLFVVFSQQLQAYNELEIINIVNSELEPLIAKAVAQIFEYEVSLIKIIRRSSIIFDLPSIVECHISLLHIGKCVHEKLSKLFDNEIVMYLYTTQH